MARDMKEKLKLCHKLGRHTQEPMSKSKSSKVAHMITDFYVQTCEEKLTEESMISN